MLLNVVMNALQAMPKGGTLSIKTHQLTEGGPMQTKLAKNLACISPFANFVYVARDLTGTGLRSLEYFEQTKDEYDGQLHPYLDKKINDAREKDPAFEEESLLDVSDRPRFVFKGEALKDKLNEVLPYWGILVLFNVVFFVAAFAGFMRYDVR